MEQSDSNIHSSPSYKLSRKRILEIIRPHSNSILNVPNSLGSTYITKVHVILSYLRKHKFCHNFRDSLNTICDCGNTDESINHHFLRCSNLKKERQSFLQNVGISNLNKLLFITRTHWSTDYFMVVLTNRTNTFLLNIVFEHITSKIHLTIFWFWNYKHPSL